MSPEQASGQPVDARSEQFALGAILYELLTGERAFKGNTTVETLSAVLQSDPPLLKSGEVRAPVGVLSLLKRCLSKDRERRFAATRDLLLDLEMAITEPAPDRPEHGTHRFNRYSDGRGEGARLHASS